MEEKKKRWGRETGAGCGCARGRGAAGRMGTGKGEEGRACTVKQSRYPRRLGSTRGGEPEMSAQAVGGRWRRARIQNGRAKSAMAPGRWRAWLWPCCESTLDHATRPHSCPGRDSGPHPSRKHRWAGRLLHGSKPQRCGCAASAAGAVCSPRPPAAFSPALAPHRFQKPVLTGHHRGRGGALNEIATLQRTRTQPRRPMPRNLVKNDPSSQRSLTALVVAYPIGRPPINIFLGSRNVAGRVCILNNCYDIILRV